jgi:hypothetical protein
MRRASWARFSHWNWLAGPIFFATFDLPGRKEKTRTLRVKRLSHSMVPGAADYQLDQREVPGFRIVVGVSSENWERT